MIRIAAAEVEDSGTYVGRFRSRLEPGGLRKEKYAAVPGRKLPLSRALCAGHEQADSTEQRYAAKDWWERNGLFPVCRGMDWTYVDYFFAMGVGDALIGEG